MIPAGKSPAEKPRIVPKTTAPKRRDVETLRVLAMFGVVWFHLETFAGDVGYAGLVVFLLLAFHFQAQSSGSRGAPARARRLLAPWLPACVFYGAFNALRGEPVYNTDGGIFAALLTGTFIHLWYLPFLFLALCALDGIDRAVDARIVGFVSGIAALALLATAGAWRSIPMDVPWAQYAHASIGVLAGAFLGRFRRLWAPGAYALLAALGAACVWRFSLKGIGVPYGVALLVTVPVLLSPRDLLPRLRLGNLPACVLGIYLSHLFFAAVVQKAGLALPLLHPVFTFILSAGFMLALRRFLPGVARRLA